MSAKSKSKAYKVTDEPASVVSDFQAVYSTKAPTSEFGMHFQSRKGVSKGFLNTIAESLGLTLYEIAPLLHVSSRTLLRYESADLLDTPISEHILLLDRLIKSANELFSKEEFIRWLNADISALDNRKPISLLDTIFGIELVENVIVRIKYGVYS